MNASEKRLAYQHNVQELYKYQSFLVGTSMIDDKDNKIVATTARINLIERKIMLLASEINKLSVEIENNSQQ